MKDGRALLLAWIALLALSTACATITRGTKQEVSLRSTPPGAIAVIYPSNQRVTTPAEVKLDRERAHTVRMDLEGYEPGWAYLDRQGDQGAMLPYLGNFLLGGIIGMLIDINSGTMFELVPVPVDVTLEPAPDTAPAGTPGTH